MIRAAGIVLWRERTPFDVEILLVHRKKQGDWSFPKGKIDDGETAIAAALRELYEETSYEGDIGQYIGSTSYRVDDEKKKVKYWMAKAISDVNFTQNDEVDRIEWLPFKMARHFLTYEEDRDILREFKKKERHTKSLILLRHTKAIKRSDWSSYDLQRPLSQVGVQQSKQLIKQLGRFVISGIYTSDAMRCIGSVEELASTLNRPLHINQILNEESFEKDTKQVFDFVRQLMKFEGNQLLCSHNPVIPSIIRDLATTKFRELPDLEPGDAYIVHFMGSEILDVEYINFSAN